MEDATSSTTKPHLLKASSFATANRSSHKPREIHRKLSLGPIKLQQSDYHDKNEKEDDPEASIVSVAVDVDDLVGVLLAAEEPPKVPLSTVEKFLDLLADEVAMFDNGDEMKCPADVGGEIDLLDAISRLSRLSSALSKFPSAPDFYRTANRAGGVLHHAMSFLEDEFFVLFLQDDSKTKQEAIAVSSNAKVRVMPSFQLPSFRLAEPPPLPPHPEIHPADLNKPIPAEVVQRMHRIAASMISGGYEIECCQLFAVARRNSLEAALPALGYEKVGTEDVLKMAWENLETDIASWIKVFTHIMTNALAAEHELCAAVFAGHRAIADRLFRSFADCAIVQLISFVEAVAMTKRSAEKLFKVLDLYQAMRDVTPCVDSLLLERDDREFSVLSDPKTEMATVKTRLGEAAVAIFCDLEGSIRNDNTKTPVPGGDVHPLTRYTMNYLEYACAYRETLEELFREQKNSGREEESLGGGDGDRNLFGEQLVEAMDQLHLNLETKSKLYKDLGLCNIFLMNNGRYVAKKVKASQDIQELAGETWYRRRSADLRQYHKNYQREAWSGLLGCLRDEGLQVKSGTTLTVSMPLLKERLRSFNAMFEEIQKTQSAWVVGDEQLKSELRVSVSTVVVPAYRSFVGRFSQYLDPGRKTEKYVKFAPEDLEILIDELFEGNTSTNASKRRP